MSTASKGEETRKLISELRSLKWLKQVALNVKEESHS